MESIIKKRGLEIGILCLLGILFLSVYFVVANCPITVDTAYYLSVSKLIAKGEVPYSEIQMVYPPLAFYILSIPYRLLGSPSFEKMMIFMILIKFAGGYFFHKTLRLWMDNKALSWVITLSFCMSTLLYEGQSILLESFVVLFHMICIYYILKPSYTKMDFFVAGIAFFCSLLCKQYAIFLVPAVGFSLVMIDDRFGLQYSRLFFLIAGALTVLVILILFFMYQGVEPYTIIKSFFVKEYGVQSFASLKEGVLMVLWRNGVYFFILPFVMMSYKGLFRDKRFLVLAAALVCSFSPFFFKAFCHYILLVIPYLLLVGAYLVYYLRLNSNKGVGINISTFFIVLFGYGVMLNVYKTIKENILFSNDQIKVGQYRTASSISSVIEKQKKVASFNSTIWPYLCDFGPIDSLNGGYLFPGFAYDEKIPFCVSLVSPQKFVNNLKTSDYLLLTEDDRSLIDPVILKHFSLYKEVEAVEVWVNKRSIDQLLEIK